MKKLAIFLPKATPFYMNLFAGLKQGFEAHGIGVTGMLVLLPDAVLKLFCQAFQPDAILEIDRTRNQVPSLPDTVIHISWIIDYFNEHGDDYHGSQLLYGLGRYWFDGNHPSRYGAVVADWLFPGFNPQTFYEAEGEESCDFSFIGHLTNPWSQEDLSTLMGTLAGKPLSFEEFIRVHLDCALTLADSGGDFPQGVFSEEVLEHMLLERGIQPIPQERARRCQLVTRYCRMRNRQHLLAGAFAMGASIKVYGTGGWSLWPQYQACYGGTRHDPNALRGLFQSSRINLHEGMPLHFRALECLASGGFLFYYEYPDYQRLGIGDVLLADEHLVVVNEKNFADKAGYYLNHPEERKRIAHQGAREVHRLYTWEKRISKILSDLSQV